MYSVERLQDKSTEYKVLTVDDFRSRIHRHIELALQALAWFYPEKFPASKMLEFYVRHFDTVELNNSFYHLPQPTLFDNWRDSTPSNSVFAVKGSRFITHMKKLKDPESSTVRFFAGAERLRKKLGPILFQLPPHWRLNVERLEEFLTALPREHRYAFEFRDASWLVKGTFEVLRKFNAALCVHDLADMKTPHELTADFTYSVFMVQMKLSIRVRILRGNLRCGLSGSLVGGPA